MSKFQYGFVGSVSCGTMRPQDLIPVFASELRYLGHRSKELTKIENRLKRVICGKYGDNDAYWEDEVASWDLDSLFDMFDSHSLPYFYFGSRPGDGADYGFWLSEEFEYRFDGLKVNDLSEIPSDYVGEVLSVTDHGNMTLWVRYGNNHLKKIWSLV